MRNITVDLSNRPPLIDDKYGGELGEHQATTLNIIPEKNMTEDTDIAFYYVLFAVEGGLVASRTFSQGEDISIALWGQLLEQRQLAFQLIGTNGLETIISKSPVLTLFLGDSLTGTVIGIDDNRDALIAMIGAFNERVDDVEEKLDTIESGAEVNVIEEIDTADGTALSVINKVVTLPDSRPLEIYKSSSKLLYKMDYIKTVFESGRKVVWQKHPVYQISAPDPLNTASYFWVLNSDKIIEYEVSANSVNYHSIFTFYVPSEPDAEKNTIVKIAKADGTELTIDLNRKVTLPDFALVSALSDYYTKSQIDGKGYLTSIPTASTSTLGGVKVDGTSISIDANGVISSSGGGGASALVVTFTTEDDDLVADYTIHEIVAAHDSGSVVLGKMMDEEAGVEFVYVLSVATEVEGFGIVEFTSLFDDTSTAMLLSILGTNEGEGDAWAGNYRQIPDNITTTTSVSKYSTDDEVPTAKAVYDYVPKADLIITAESSVSVLEFINQDLTNFNIQYNSTIDEMLAKLNVHKMLTVDGGVSCPMTELDLSFEDFPNSFAQAPWHIIACAKIDNGWLNDMGYVESNTKDGVWIRIIAEYNTGSTSTNAQIRWSPKTKKDLLIYEDDNGNLTYDGYVV